MARIPLSLYNWLCMNGYKDIIPLLGFGRSELFTEEMRKEYEEWMKTDDGKAYSKNTRL